MDYLSDLKPTECSRLMDLVAEAGIDVAEWGNSGRSAASNPKYDTESNVAALCPNDHRKAHFGDDQAAMRQQLIDQIRAAEMTVMCGNLQG